MIIECVDCKRGFHTRCDGGAWVPETGDATDCDCYMAGHLEDDDTAEDEGEDS